MKNLINPPTFPQGIRPRGKDFYPVRKKAFDEVGGIYSCRSRWFKATDKRHLSNGVYYAHSSPRQSRGVFWEGGGINRFSLWLAAVFILSAVFFSNVAQASFLDMIRAWVTINPLAVEVANPKAAVIDKNFKLEAKAINQGEEKIENGQAEIFLPPELVLIGPEPLQEIKIIPGKKEKKIAWQIRGKQAGNYIILVKVAGELRGQVLSAEASAVAKVKESLSRGRASKWLQNLFKFLQKMRGG